jgi:hypothetical protein
MEDHEVLNREHGLRANSEPTGHRLVVYVTGVDRAGAVAEIGQARGKRFLALSRTERAGFDQSQEYVPEKRALHPNKAPGDGK